MDMHRFITLPRRSLSTAAYINRQWSINDKATKLELIIPKVYIDFVYLVRNLAVAATLA